HRNPGARLDIMLLPALLIAAQAANVPELPKDVPATATRYTVLIMGQTAGQHAVWTEGGRLRAFFQYNDRGRGPKTYSTLTLRDGIPVSEQIDGNDYMKDAVSESFSNKDGAASWKSKAEQGSRKVSGPAFYPSMYGPPIEFALLARAALDRGGSIPLLPEGEARIAKVREAAAQAGGKSQPVTLYAVTGLDFSPVYLWLDARREYFASGGVWQSVIREGWEAAMPELIK